MFLALHETTGQVRAVKRVERRGGADESRELKNLRSLHHAGLPQMIEVISDEENYWIAMSYVKGKSLQQIMNIRHRLDTAKTVDAGKQLCRILMYLHSRKDPVLHLDLKPANIMVRQNGQLVLLDFGSALRKGKKRAVCLPQNERQGTDGFAPPELYNPAAEVDERSDIYELGAVLYYLISGVVYSPVFIKSHISACPEELDVIIHKCLAAAPDERYGSVREVFTELEKIDGRQKQRKRREYCWAAVALILLSIGILTRAVPETFAHGGIKGWDYEHLLREAGSAAGEEKTNLYLRAVTLAPGKSDAYSQLITEAMEDGKTDLKEMNRILTILHSCAPGSKYVNEERLAEDKEEYGKICLRMGLLCRFADDRELKAAANPWLRKAQESLKEADTSEDDAISEIILLCIQLEKMKSEEEITDCLSVYKQLVSDASRELIGEEIVEALAQEALTKIAQSAVLILKEGVDAEEIRESAEYFAKYDGETDGKNKQRLQLIDHMLGMSEGKETTAWEEVTEGC